jgi:hypothetical protein
MPEAAVIAAKASFSANHVKYCLHVTFGLIIPSGINLYGQIYIGILLELLDWDEANNYFTAAQRSSLIQKLKIPLGTFQNTGCGCGS